ncbi:MAG: hypothetical protein JOZ97_03640 [Candidatus Eremiobacteraeota bacterium]|nr:hypothetical protein [Candidatus Eremiobacteraeota bacterium]
MHQFGAVALAVTIFAASSTPAHTLSTSAAVLSQAHRRFIDNYAVIERHGGHDLAEHLVGRFSLDHDAIYLAPPPSYSSDDWRERTVNVVRLDSALVEALIAGQESDFRGESGLFEGVFRVHADATLQPYALYVPPSYSTARPHSLVILLHGQPQTEAEILGAPYFRKLADQTGTVIAAPYGRGLYNFPAPANVEVYELLDRVLSMFPTDSHRVFLAGYSMGGFSVYRVGALNAWRWAGVMSIAGAVLNSEAELVKFRFRDMPFYIVTGKKDSVIPAQYGEDSAVWLNSVDIPTGLYEEPLGDHWLGTLVPSLSAAWHDMIAGVVSPAQSNGGTHGPALPPNPPRPSVKP